jgi:hypothetical protein
MMPSIMNNYVGILINNIDQYIIYNDIIIAHLEIEIKSHDINFFFWTQFLLLLFHSWENISKGVHNQEKANVTITTAHNTNKLPKGEKAEPVGHRSEQK